MLTPARITQLERLGARVTAPLPAKVMANLLIKKRRTGQGHRRSKRSVKQWMQQEGFKP